MLRGNSPAVQRRNGCGGHQGFATRRAAVSLRQRLVRLFLISTRDLDLGFYRVPGLQPLWVMAELNFQLDDRLRDALHPCIAALQATGLRPYADLRENTSIVAHGVGLLLLHTGRIRMFGPDAPVRVQVYLMNLVVRPNCPAPSITSRN